MSVWVSVYEHEHEHEHEDKHIQSQLRFMVNVACAYLCFNLVQFSWIELSWVEFSWVGLSSVFEWGEVFSFLYPFKSICVIRYMNSKYSQSPATLLPLNSWIGSVAWSRARALQTHTDHHIHTTSIAQFTGDRILWRKSVICIYAMKFTNTHI